MYPVLTRSCLLSRREFLTLASIVSAGVCLPACRMQAFSKPFNLTQQDIDRAENAYDGAKLTETLERILVWMKKNNPVVAAALKPGLTKSEIADKVSSLPFQLPEEVIALYQWRNGVREDCPGSFIWYHNFLSLDRAIHEYEGMNGLNLSGWHKNWFPLFDFEGEYYFVPCSKKKHSALPIGYYFLEETEATVCYTNLTTMMQTALECFETGAVFVEDKEKGILRENIRDVKRIYEKHNPGLQFPYHVPAEGRSQG
jgi:cell wall assembly regulator SMI1